MGETATRCANCEAAAHEASRLAERIKSLERELLMLRSATVDRSAYDSVVAMNTVMNAALLALAPSRADALSLLSAAPRRAEALARLAMALGRLGAIGDVPSSGPTRRWALELNFHDAEAFAAARTALVVWQTLEQDAGYG